MWGLVIKRYFLLNKKDNKRLLLCIFDVDSERIFRDGSKSFVWQGHCCFAWVKSTIVDHLHDYGCIHTWSLSATDAPHSVSPTTSCSIVPYAIAHRSKISIWRELIRIVTIAFCCFTNKANEIRWRGIGGERKKNGWSECTFRTLRF